MEETEPPECPVCLQPYDADIAVPRVLSCGHSTCEACLKLLPNPFPNTLRCTVCTLLVKFSVSPSFLPKNIDLLHISSVLQRRLTGGKSELPLTSVVAREKYENPSFSPLIPKPWSYEFYCKWKHWILPEGSIRIEKVDGSENDRYSLSGEVLKSFDSYHIMWSVFAEKEIVEVVKIGIFKADDDLSRFFKHSYESRILSVLYGMNEKERTELDYILNLNFRSCSLGKAYGFWCNENDNCVYIVLEKFDSPNLWQNVYKKEGMLKFDEMIGFGMLGMEMCEILSCLHFQGLILGSLSVNCFVFNNFHRIYADFNEVLNMGRRLNFATQRSCGDSVGFETTLFDENPVFISPEILRQFLVKGFKLPDKRPFDITNTSDVWSLAGLLVWIILGESFSEEMKSYLLGVVSAFNSDDCDYSGMYMIWKEKIASLLGCRIGTECVNLTEILSRCLEFDPGNRPDVTKLWKCLRELVINPQNDAGISLKQEGGREKNVYCLVLGMLCQIVDETGKKVIYSEGDDNKSDNDKVKGVSGDIGRSISSGHMKCLDLKGHLDCVTGLAIGGGFLFSSSYDKMVCIWSLQDFAHVHCFKGHEHRVMAVAFVDGEKPLCISGDNEGVICLWNATFPFDDMPIKKLYEHKDWRYSGIHALAVSGNEVLYTGNGDKLIKAWSLQDYTQICSLKGHKSVVSSLVVCNGVLYSGSWDGTVRLWSLSDHSQLTVLGEDKLGNMASVTALSANHHFIFAGHENGCIKIWHNDVLLKCTQTHGGSILSVCSTDKWLFSGGWDKKINVQEVSQQDGIDSIPTGTIDCDSVITSLIYSEGKLFVGHADRLIKVYYGTE